MYDSLNNEMNTNCQVHVWSHLYMTIAECSVNVSETSEAFLPGCYHNN